VSYVRWSTPLRLPEGVSGGEYYLNSDRLYWDIPTSDFYIYEHCGGFYSVNVAGNRRKASRPFDGAKVVDGEGVPASSGRPSDDWMAWLDEGREYIDHPAAGKSFEFATMREVIEKVEQLIGDGFLAPDYLLPNLREEADAVAGGEQ
jgi:hypothetical protein